jgi:Tfp pilus assembly protein PilO
MKRLPAAKRNQLIGVILATVACVALVYWFLINAENREIAKLVTESNKQRAELKAMKELITKTDATANTLAEISRQLNRAEEDIATGDIYAWTYDTIRRFKANYRVEIPSIGQPILGDVDLIQGFPYRQVKMSLNGTGYYHDLGKFVADFENTFPHMRMVNLGIEPSQTPGGLVERLNFHMDIIALVKPNS